MTIERDVRRNVAIHAHRLGELGIFLVSLERALAKQVTTLHATVLLSLSKWVRFACNFTSTPVRKRWASVERSGYALNPTPSRRAETPVRP